MTTPADISSETVGNAVVQSSIVSLIAKLSGLGTAFITFHYLSPEAYGMWRLALAAVAVAIGMLSSLSPLVSVEAIRSLSNSKEPHGLSLWRGFVRVTILIALGIMIMSAFFAPLIASAFRIQPSLLVALAFTLLLFWLLRSHAVSWLQITYRFDRLLRLQIIESVAYVVSLFLLLVVRHEGVIGLALANLATASIASIFTIPIVLSAVRRCPPSTIKQDVTLLFSLLRQNGKWGFANDAVKYTLETSRLWLISFFLGPAAVGLYGLADSLFGYVVSLVNLDDAVSSSLPRFVHDKPRLTAAMEHAVRIGTIVSVGVFVVTWIAIIGFFPILFPKYLPAIPLYALLSLSVLFGGFRVLVNTMVPALRQQKMHFFLLLPRVVFLILFLAVFLPRIGISAVGLEVLIGMNYFVLVRFIWLRKHLNIHQEGLNAYIPTTKDFWEVISFLRKKALQIRAKASAILRLDRAR